MKLNPRLQRVMRIVFWPVPVGSWLLNLWECRRLRQQADQFRVEWEKLHGPTSWGVR